MDQIRGRVTMDINNLNSLIGGRSNALKSHLHDKNRQFEIQANPNAVGGPLDESMDKLERE